MPEGFFMNDTNKRTIDRCFYSCKTCESYGNENDNNCLECISGYYSTIYEAFSNCYNESNGYYLNNNIYKPCYLKCNYCFR